MTGTGFEATAVGGTLVGWVDGEDDGPRVLLLHGGPGLSAHLSEGIADELVPAYRVAVFQQRGLAPSTTDGPFTVAQAVDDVVAVLDHLGWDTAHLVGHSWGGHLVLHCAVSIPQRLQGVLAVDPLGGVGDGGAGEFEAAMLARTPPADLDRVVELEAASQRGEATEVGVLEQLRLVWPAYYADPASAPPIPDGVHVSLEAAGGVSSDLVARLPELERALAGVTVPLGVLVGRESPMPPAAAGRATAEQVAGAWVVEVEGAGHFPWHEVPGCVRAAVDGLVSGDRTR